LPFIFALFVKSDSQIIMWQNVKEKMSAWELVRTCWAICILIQEHVIGQFNVIFVL
jgi:hypothetical protein